VEVTALAGPTLLIEVEVLAIIGSSGTAAPAARSPKRSARVATGRRGKAQR
jgi:hypothetical protein